MGDGEVEPRSRLAGKHRDENGFILFTFKKLLKVAGQTGRKAREYLSYNRTSRHETVKKHLVEEQTEEGKWEVKHDETNRYPAKHRK